MNINEFYEDLNKLNITLSDKQKELLNIYYEFLIEYNTHTNLTSITNKEEVYYKHFYDSILLSNVYDLNTCNTLLDIGTGAGFPGVILKILYPNIKLTLLDSNNKKTTFLKELIKKLELDNIEIINARAEEFIKNRREYYDIVTARAVKNLQILIELSIPFVKINGYFIAMKSNYLEELNNSLNGIKLLGAEYEKTYEFNLPKNYGIRNLIKIKKVNITNIKYPRSYSKIINKPL